MLEAILTFDNLINIVSALISFGAVLMYIIHAKYFLIQTRHSSKQLKILESRLQNDTALRQMQFHSRFQDRIRDIQTTIKELACDEEINRDQIEIQLNRYWSLVFDEWFVCKRGGNELKELWEKYYRPVVRYALKNELFLNNIEDDFNNGRSFMRLHQEFREEIKKLAWEANNIGLRLNNH